MLNNVEVKLPSLAIEKYHEKRIENIMLKIKENSILTMNKKFFILKILVALS